MNLGFLNRLRLEELQLLFQKTNFDWKQKKVLEIGSGTGAQLLEFEKLGAQCVGIDLASSNYAHAKINERVLLYDGKTIPFADDYFDFVFSSNVLEHIQDYAGFQQEIRRVLKSDGIAIHILPTHSWKFWTLISHYPALFKIIYQKIFSCKDISTTLAPNSAKKSIKKLAINTLFPERHGEFGNRFTEYYYFMPKTWIKKFIGSGWKIIKVQPGGILYGGYNLLASSLNFNIRKKISRYLGSACFIFILQK